MPTAYQDRQDCNCFYYHKTRYVESGGLIRNRVFILKSEALHKMQGFTFIINKVLNITFRFVSLPQGQALMPIWQAIFRKAGQ